LPTNVGCAEKAADGRLAVTKSVAIKIPTNRQPTPKRGNLSITLVTPLS
jgi:hypothetical protein